MKPKVVIVDEDEHFAGRLCRLLLRRGYDAAHERKCEAVMASIFETGTVDVVLLGRPYSSRGQWFFLDALAGCEDPPAVIVMVASGDFHHAISGMKRGAFDDLIMPFELSELEAKIQRALAARGKRRRPDGRRGSIRKRLEEVFMEAALAEANLDGFRRRGGK